MLSRGRIPPPQVYLKETHGERSEPYFFLIVHLTKASSSSLESIFPSSLLLWSMLRIRHMEGSCFTPSLRRSLPVRMVLTLPDDMRFNALSPLALSCTTRSLFLPGRERLLVRVRSSSFVRLSVRARYKVSHPSIFSCV